MTGLVSVPESGGFFDGFTMVDGFDILKDA